MSLSDDLYSGSFLVPFTWNYPAMVGAPVSGCLRRPNGILSFRNNRLTVRTYIKRQGHWQLLAEHLETIPGERTAVKIDTKIYDDYVGQYESAIFDFEVVKDGEHLMAVPKERTTTHTSQGRPPAELFPE